MAIAELREGAGDVRIAVRLPPASAGAMNRIAGTPLAHSAGQGIRDAARRRPRQRTGAARSGN